MFDAFVRYGQLKKTTTFSSPRRPLDSPGIHQRILPFGIVGCVACIALLLSPSTHNNDLYWAAGITSVIASTTIMLPWNRLPQWFQALPPLALFPVIALIRNAEGGTTSGFTPLCALPVFWLALYGTRNQLRLAIVLCGLTFALPLLFIGSPHYPAHDWQRVISWVSITTLIGPSVQSIVRQQQRQIDNAQLLVTLGKSQDIAETRQNACRIAQQIADTKFVALMEMTSHQRLVCTASSGINFLGMTTNPYEESSGTSVAFLTGKRHFSPNTTKDECVSPELIKTGTQSAIFEPLITQSGVAGVFILGFKQRLPALDTHLLTSLDLITKEIASVIERAVHIEQLDILARNATDIVSIQNMEGTFTYVSDSIENILGFGSDEFLTFSRDQLLRLIHPGDREEFTFFFNHLLPETTSPKKLIGRISDRDGNWRWIETTARVVRDQKTGEPRQIRSASRDITERRTDEEEVRQANEQLTSVLDAATECSIIGTDTHGVINLFNVGAERMLGYSTEEIVGYHTPEIFHDATEIQERASTLGIAPDFEVFVHQVRAGKQETNRWIYVTKSHRRIPVSLTINATHNAHGEIDGFISVAEKISNRTTTLPIDLRAIDNKNKNVRE